MTCAARSEPRESIPPQYTPQWLHFRERAKIILNSLLHFRHELASGSRDGAGPLRRGMPLCPAFAITICGGYMDVTDDLEGVVSEFAVRNGASWGRVEAEPGGGGGSRWEEEGKEELY